jgi:hypothetical protein
MELISSDGGQATMAELRAYSPRRILSTVHKRRLQSQSSATSTSSVAANTLLSRSILSRLLQRHLSALLAEIIVVVIIHHHLHDVVTVQ